MTVLEDRLRSELRAEAERITPGSIISLELPVPDGRPASRLRRGGPRHRPGWAKPMAAAAAVAAVVSGTFAVTRVIPGAPQAAARPAVSGVPAYYAASVPGYLYHHVTRKAQSSSSVDGRYLAIRATATGKLLATISPPAPYNDFTLLTGAADGRVFIAGAQRLRNNGPVSSPSLAELDESTPMRFIVVRVTPGGGVQISGLSLPRRVSPAQGPTIALSPDGTRLAVAYGGSGKPAVLQVMTLATGGVRRWVLPHTAWAPQVEGAGAWTADGRTLAVVQSPGSGGPPVTPQTYRPPRTTRVRLLDTTAPATGLTAGTLLVLHAPAGQLAPGQPYLTPDGSLLISPVTSPGGPWLPRGRLTGELAVYSAGTGALLRTMAPWVWRYPSPPGRGGEPKQILAWSEPAGGRLILLQPSRDLNVLAAVAGSRFAPAGSKLLPRRSGAYQVLQSVLRQAALVAW
jgi:hypothetical protein